MTESPRQSAVTDAAACGGDFVLLLIGIKEIFKGSKCTFSALQRRFILLKWTACGCPKKGQIQNDSVRQKQRIGDKAMGNKVTFDYSKVSGFVKDTEVESMKKIVAAAKEELVSRNGAGNDFLGWIDLPVDYDKEEFARIKKAAEKIQERFSEVLLVIGIGGSYLGARAAIEFLRHSFYNMCSEGGTQDSGDLFCRKQHQQHIHHRPDGCHRQTVISLSMSFPNPVRPQSRQSHSVYSRRCWRRNTAKKRLQSVSMRQQTRQEGALKNLATEEGYETFVVPDDVGGRFSVLTAVGLLPIAVSGADIDKLMEGAASGRKNALENCI